MRQTIIICDKCKNRISGEYVTLAVCDAEDTEASPVEWLPEDICMDCVNEFLRPNAPKPKAKRSKIDRGKVWALKDAGWKVPDIARDVKCSEATVYNILAERTDSDEDRTD